MKNFYPFDDAERLFVDDSPTSDQFCIQCEAFCGSETCRNCGAPLCARHGELCAICQDAEEASMSVERFYDGLWHRQQTDRLLEEMGL